MARALLEGQRMRELHDDQRGAVMITGLFMAFFLIGALWFVLGIGDALVFRERMQEAADHGAFTSAALQAKGMNFIAACNLVMLAMVTIHLVLGIVHDIALAACGISIVIGGLGCGAWKGARSAYLGYAKVMKPALRAIHVAEVAAAYGYPWVGFVKGFQVGEKYGKQHRVGDVDVFPVGPTLVPDTISGADRIGLPVKSAKMSFHCKKLTALVLEKALGAYDFSPGALERFLGRITFGRFGKSDEQKVLEKFREIAGKAIAYRYCNGGGSDDEKKEASARQKKLGDATKKGTKKIEEENEKKEEDEPKIDLPVGDLMKALDPAGFDAFWGEDGPLVPTHGNGDGNYQVYALNVLPTMTDPSERKVAIPTRRSGGIVGEERPLGYFAQAELYFDCAEKWGDPSCNGDGGLDANATFSMKWRARLRHVELPKLSTFLAEQLVSAITDSSAYEQLKKIITEDNPLARKLEDGKIGAVAVKALKVGLETAMKKGEDLLEDRIAQGLEPIDPQLMGCFH
jgi:hypothetical protein